VFILVVVVVQVIMLQDLVDQVVVEMDQQGIHQQFLQLQETQTLAVAVAAVVGTLDLLTQEVQERMEYLLQKN
tara:strand:+ start:273 stop:491 length:219 start_codon:yes stop_codon:yes gene_type:complete